MVAPRVHPDMIDYYTYRSTKTKKELIACTICMMVGWLGERTKYEELLEYLEELFNYYKENEGNFKDCADKINKLRPDPKLYTL